MSNRQEKQAKMLADLNIPEHITKDKYPSVDFNIDGNVFSVIGAVSKGWRRVDAGVASRISTVVNDHAEDYDEALGFLLSISKVEYGDEDNE